MTEKRKYDSTVARMAGNIAAALIAYNPSSGPYIRADHERIVAVEAVSLARAIIAEVERTEPQPIEPK